MTANIKDYDLSIRNSVDMISLLSTAESALDQITNVQQKLANLAVQSASGTYEQQDRDSMELELYALVAEIDRIAVNTRYSDVSLLDGSFGVSASGGPVFSLFQLIHLIQALLAAPGESRSFSTTVILVLAQ